MGWPRIEFPGAAGPRGQSKLQWSRNKAGHIDLRAMCGHCQRTRSRTLHANETGRNNTLKALGQGRPLGMLWAWLTRGGGADCELGGANHRDWVPTYAERVVGRLAAEAFVPAAAVFRSGGRPPNTGVADGPEGEPFQIA